jgi:iron complex outermembrane recepter protein
VAYRRKGIAAALAYALGIGSTAAWIDASAQEQQNQRILVTVTGSNIIPRIEGETALPVQVITREDIERANFQTAAELLKTVSANMSSGSFTEVQLPVGSSQPGLAGASLRGLTYQRTLILFNGRRIANYALTGSAIDLNVIPVAAIERVEILKDGASAIYGSDALGGVINFIMRTSYQGAEASVQYASPEHTGGYSEHYNLTAGYGDLASQKFNAFAMVDWQQFGGVIAKDRPFAQTAYIPNERVDQTSDRSFPGNIDTPRGTFNPTGDPNNGYKNPSCAPPLSFPTNASPTQCRFDYVRGVDIVAPSERLNLLGTFTWQIDPDNQLFLNGNYARNRFTIVGAPTGISNATTFQGINHFFLPPTSAFYPHAFAQFFGIDGQPLNIRWRSVELGPRTDAPIVEQSNFVAGMRGLLKGWNYDGAFSYGESTITDRYVDGYVKESAIIPILNSGVVNPFGLNTPDVVALLSTAKLDGTVRTGKASSSSVDFHASNEIFQLPAGPLALALGAEVRQWKLTENSGADMGSGNIVNVSLIPSMKASRTVWAAFAEANAPIVKTLEGNLAVRYDHNSDVGATTNPKLSIRWQPSKTFLMRASAGTGFRAPGLEGLYEPPVFGNTSVLNDPIRCPVTNSTQDCNRSFPSESGGNPLLKSEKSAQWGVGGVWAPVPGLSLGADYFDILVKSLIFSLNSQTIFQLCPDGVNGSTCQFIHRGPVDPAFPTLPGPIVLVDQTLFNIGKVRITGIDVNAEYRFPKLDWGQLKLSLQGTYNIRYLQQQTNGGYLNLVNHYGQGANLGVIPYWQHYLVLDWDYGPWSATLTQSYQQGTYDQNPGPNTGSQPRVVGDYELWNLSGSYSGFRKWTLSAGIKNLIDRNPPFSNQTFGGSNGSATGYDTTYTDPRGRLYWAGIKYVFK